MQKYTQLAQGLPRTLRLGLATRGNSRLQPRDVFLALDVGVNYFNWCGYPDGLSDALAQLPANRREKIVIAAQFSARSAEEAETELDEILKVLNTEYIDIVTFYYVESNDEWQQIISPSGSMGYFQNAQRLGKVRLLGLTSHQRQLAAAWAQSGLLDLLMIRFNAAHRKAMQEVFPVTRRLGIPVVAFTCLRWTTLLKATPANEPNYTPAPALEWYRYVLSHSEIAVALMAPGDTKQLKENLRLLEDWRPLSEGEIAQFNRQGDLVRHFHSNFP
ncbi:MAG TPA: aldo/keto reductase [Acidobacteriota bacterium]|nr:aldo/keto reductase [Acidobacteriota bacterium]